MISSGNYNENIEQLSGQYQGDMVLSEKQERALKKGMDRTGLIDVNMRWPNKVVPYVLSEVFNDEQKNQIEAGLAELARVSCLTFTPRTDEVNFVRVNVRIIYYEFISFILQLTIITFGSSGSTRWLLV